MPLHYMAWQLAWSFVMVRGVPSYLLKVPDGWEQTKCLDLALGLTKNLVTGGYFVVHQCLATTV
jgi:hypothetical protein